MKFLQSPRPQIMFCVYYKNNNFEDGMDYKLSKQLIDEGRTNKSIYMLTLGAFKIILLRYRNTRKICILLFSFKKMKVA